MCRFALVPLAALLAAWGPHPEITDAGLAALGPGHPLLGRLGAESAKLREYCWMADWRRTLQSGFYADDYLLFPAAPRHLEHECPGVRAAYEPYFRRALQALRTETPMNAARWIGSILHFTEDTGSPPHAAQFSGDLHSKMENWVDARSIQITGYSPHLLGDSDDAAVAGFLRRMEELISFSKERGLRLKPIIESGDRTSAEPLILECALETSRVVADLLFTLGRLAEPVVLGGASLQGKIASKAPPGLEAVPAKIMIEGTLFSTLADATGAYEFHDLPAGSVHLLVTRAGSQTARTPVTLERDGHHEKDIALEPSSPAGNLLRNGDFRVLWTSAKSPDGWSLSRDTWEGEPVPVPTGGRLRLAAGWKESSRGEVWVRWRNSSVPYGPSTDQAVLTQGQESSVIAVPEKITHVRVLFRGAAPHQGWSRVSLTLEPGVFR
jgi:hypothetical protein